MKFFMRRFVQSLLVASLLLGGCVAAAPSQSTGQATGTPPPTQEETSPADAATEQATDGTTEGADTANLAEEAGEETSELAGTEPIQECEEGFRLFAHELLLTAPVCIPTDPQRVLPLDMASLEMTLLAGKTPTATAAWMLNEMPLLIPEFADFLAPVEGVGYPANLEQVARLAPDLILAPQDTIEYELAGAIAPVVVPDPVIYADWKLGMQFWADALNVAERYAEMEENYLARVSELQNAMGEAAEQAEQAEQEVSIVSITANGLMMWMADTAPGAILADIGLDRPASQRFVGDAALAEYGDKQWVQISTERLDLVDGDAIFYFTFATVDPEAAARANSSVDAFEQEPIWLSLDGVQAGRAYRVGGHWWRAQTYYLANQVIDDLFTHLTDTTAATPVLTLE